MPPLVTSDEFKYHEQTLRRAFSPTAVYVQIDNRYRKNRIVRTRSKLLLRFMCSYLRRRTPAPMRKPRKLTETIDLLRSFYNFVRPHSSLRFGKVMRTPARQAECFSRALTFMDIFRWVPPPRPGSSRVKVNLGV